MIIILNFKTYPEAEGENAVSCAEAAYNFSRNSKHKIIICPQSLDIENILEKFDQDDTFEVWAQHVDFQRGKKETGFVTVDTLKMIGVTGSLVNHAEHKVGEVEKYVGLDKEMKLCFCVSNLLEMGVVVGKNPDFHPAYVAYEAPELIGGALSVADTNPDDIERIVNQYSAFDILVGAGIGDREDVMTSLKLGAKGILISSAYVYASDREEFLKDLTT